MQMIPKQIKSVNTFHNTGRDWSAESDAVDWASGQGFGVGAKQRAAPRGLVRGAEYVAKWRNLTQVERYRLHGQIIFPSGDARRGSAVVEIYAKGNEE